MAEALWWQELARRETREPDEAEYEMMTAARVGLLDGDMLPLAGYLKAGYELNYMLKRDLVAAITGEGDHPYRLHLTKEGQRGPGTALSKMKTQLRDLQIGLYMERRLPNARDKVEAAAADAMQEFGEKRGVVMSAWTRWKARNSPK